MNKIRTIAAVLAVMFVGSASADEVTTLKNSAADLNPYVAQRDGIFLGLLFEAIMGGPHTKLKTSTESWMDSSNNTIVLNKVPYVSGTVYGKDIDAAGSVFAVTMDADYRYLKGNGLPSTPMGKFPVEQGTAAYSYYSVAPAGHDPRTGIPGSDYSSAAAIGVSPYNLDVMVPLHPRYSKIPNPIDSLVTGVALTGTVWHVEVANASSTDWYNPLSILPLDDCFGHPYSQQYHLHSYSWKCFPNQGTTGPSPLVGYALDGFGIYGPRGDDGKMITNAQLDECHGMISKVMWEGKLTKIYHYVLNNEYPYSIGCFRGVVNTSLALLRTTKHSHGMLKSMH